MSDDDDLDEFLDCYNSSSTKNIFKQQVAKLKVTAKEEAVASQENPVFDLFQSAAPAAVVPEKVEEPVVHDVFSDFISKPESKPVVSPEIVETPIVCVPTPPIISEVIISAEGEELAEDDPFSETFDVTEVPDSEENIGAYDIRRYMTRAAASKAKLKGKSQPKRKKTADVAECIVLEPEIEKQSEIDDVVNYETMVKVIWKSGDIIRIPVRRMQKLVKIYEHFMELENVPMDKILLTRNGVKVKPTDSPDSLDLNVCDFLDGGIVSNSVSFNSNTPKAEKAFHVKFQDSSRNVTSIPCKPEEALQMAMLRFSEQIMKPVDGIKFMFDGVKINKTDTPLSLDIENGDVIDVEF